MEQDQPSSRLGQIEHEILDVIRRAREPVRESVLYERLRARGVDIAPDQFIGVAERLAVFGHVRIAFEHDLPNHDPEPFQPRYYRLVE